MKQGYQLWKHSNSYVRSTKTTFFKQIKVLHLKTYLSKSTEVVKVLILQKNGPCN